MFAPSMIHLNTFLFSTFLAFVSAETNLLPLGSLLGVSVLSGNKALISPNIIVDVLGVTQCSTKQLVGIKTNFNLLGLNLLNVCACVEVLNLPNTVSCPTCPTHASPICGGSHCGCECDVGYYATSLGTCVPTTACPAPNILDILLDGTGACRCARAWANDGAGGCFNLCLSL